MQRLMCRICLSESNCFISIHDKFGERFIWTVINEFADVSVSENDNNPQMICNICYKRLRDAINLKEEIRQTDRLLKARLFNEEIDTRIEVEYLYDDPEAKAAVLSDFEVSGTQKEDDDILIEDPENTTQSNNIECCLCERTFFDAESCQTHVIASHATIVDNNISHRKKFKVFKYPCPFCQKGFRRKNSIDNHLKDKSFIEVPYKKSPDRWRKPTQCQACGKVFSDRFEAVNHYDRVHETNKTFNCDKCGKLFANERLLNRHRIIHGPKHFSCDICKRQFPLFSQLKSHMGIHLTVKKYKCEICPKTFSHKSVLDTHIRQHSELKPFKCEKCPKEYKWPEDLNTHRKAEHEGIFPYYCVFCNKGLLSSSNKKHHEKRCNVRGE